MVRQCKTQSLPGAAKEKEVVLVEELEMAQDSEQALEMVQESAQKQAPDSVRELEMVQESAQKQALESVREMEMVQESAQKQALESVRELEMAAHCILHSRLIFHYSRRLSSHNIPTQNDNEKDLSMVGQCKNLSPDRMVMMVMMMLMEKAVVQA